MSNPPEYHFMNWVCLTLARFQMRGQACDPGARCLVKLTSPALVLSAVTASRVEAVCYWMPQSHSTKGEPLRIDCSAFEFQYLSDKAQMLPTGSSTHSPISYCSQDIEQSHDTRTSEENASLAMPTLPKVRWKDESQAFSRYGGESEHTYDYQSA